MSVLAGHSGIVRAKWLEFLSSFFFKSKNNGTQYKVHNAHIILKIRCSSGCLQRNNGVRWINRCMTSLRRPAPRRTFPIGYLYYLYGVDLHFCRSQARRRRYPNDVFYAKKKKINNSSNIIAEFTAVRHITILCDATANHYNNILYTQYTGLSCTVISVRRSRYDAIHL